MVHDSRFWVRTDGVNANGAAAKVMNFDRLVKKVRPGTFGKIQLGKREYPKSASVNKHEICSDPISADPFCPFPTTSPGRLSGTHDASEMSSKYVYV